MVFLHGDVVDYDSFAIPYSEISEALRNDGGLAGIGTPQHPKPAVD
jgi:hypothetical protein